MTRVHRQLILLLILLALALSGCRSNASDDTLAVRGEPPPPPPADSSPPPADPPPPPADPAPTAMAEPTPPAEPTATAEPEPTEVAIGPPPAFREELEATDPQTVVLGAGRPQLVELFAFW